jgi:hypothetical protein
MEAATVNPEVQSDQVAGADTERSVPPVLVAILVPFIAAALLKPRFLNPNDNPEALHIKIEDLWTITVGLILWGLIALAVVSIIFTLVQGNLVNFEKVVFIAMCVKCSLLAMIVCNHERFIVAQLLTVERDIWDARDQISLILQGVKSMIHKLNDRVSGVTSAEAAQATDVLRSFGPLAMLFLSKERSMLRWGMAAADLARKGFSYLSRQK